MSAPFIKDPLLVVIDPWTIVTFHPLANIPGPKLAGQKSPLGDMSGIRWSKNIVASV